MTVKPSIDPEAEPDRAVRTGAMRDESRREKHAGVERCERRDALDRVGGVRVGQDLVAVNEQRLLKARDARVGQGREHLGLGKGRAERGKV